MLFKLLKAKKNIPTLIFPFACLHLIKLRRYIPKKSIDMIIRDEKVEIIYQKMGVKGKYEKGRLFINPDFKDKEKEIISHELFHYFEEKHNLHASKIISETAARLFSRVS